MPNYISIELNTRNLLVACAKSVGRRFQINQLIDIELDGNETDQQLGEKLKLALSEKGVSRSEMIAVISRQHVEIREVTVPPAPDNELPELVRFQAKNVFASMNESWLLDFVPFEDDSSEQTRVLATAISPQLKQQYVAIADAAGMKLKRIVFRPYVFCNLLESQISDSKNRLLVDPNEHQFDFSVTAGNRLIATRAVKRNPDQDANQKVNQFVNEVRRTIASTKSALEGDGIDQIWIGADKNDYLPLAESVLEKLDVPVIFTDAFRCLNAASLVVPKPKYAERYSALIGSLAREYSDKSQVVDFINPRKPIVKRRDFKKILIGAGVAALLLICGIGYGWYVLGQQSNTIADKTEFLEEQIALNKGDSNRPGVAQIVGEVEQLDKWQATDINWLDELSAISDRLLTPDDIIVSRFSGSERAKGSNYHINLTIRTTKHTSPITEWKNKFFDHFDDFRSGETSEDEEDSDYPVTQKITLVGKFDVDATIEKNTIAAMKNREKFFEAEQQAAELKNDNSSAENTN